MTDVAADWRRTERVLRHAADQTLRKEVNAGIRRAAKPLGHDVIVTGASELPRRGGLAYRVGGATVGVSISGKGVALRLRTREGYDLDAMDKGSIRHPVFGRWVKATKAQSIRPGAFTRPFEAGRPLVEKEILTAMETVAADINRALGGNS